MQTPQQFSVFFALLMAAVYCDVRRHRIPNTLTLAGLSAGIVLETASGGVHGLGVACVGAAFGLACFFPLYLLRGMGAGDVKLLAALGTFLGPLGVVYAALFSLIAGGFVAIVHVAWRALRVSAARMLSDGLAAAGASACIAASLARRDRLPFALPIAIGSLAACVYLFDTTGAGAWLPQKFQ